MRERGATGSLKRAADMWVAWCPAGFLRRLPLRGEGLRLSAHERQLSRTQDDVAIGEDLRIVRECVPRIWREKPPKHVGKPLRP